MTKACGACGIEKPMAEFYRHSRDGYQSRCKDCKRADSRERNRTPARREYNKQLLRKTYPERKQTYYARVDVREKRAAQMRDYRKNPELRVRMDARRAVRAAIERGEIERKPCEVCGAIRAQAHHPDYSRPLFVKWLCVPHHRAEHAKAEGRGE